MIDYNDIVKSFDKNPRNVHTVPNGEKTPVWFWVSVKNGTVYVESGKTSYSNSKISSPRALKKEKFNTALNLYKRRKNGEQVSREATEKSYNQVYWYGVFSDMGL